jgi:hypothetical protein
MTDGTNQISINLEISIGLANQTNRQALREFQHELEQSGYATDLGVRSPSGQFSASLETITITIGTGAATALTALVVKDIYEGIKKLTTRLRRHKQSDGDPKITISIPIGDDFAVGIRIEAKDGKQVLNLLVRDVDNIKELPTRPDRPHGHDLS